jgi:cytochrome bd-type quinol oxidase subunit 2
MSKYNTFLTVFIISIIAFVIFMVLYLNAIFGFAFHVHEQPNPDPFEVIFSIFSPGVIISGIVLVVTSLVYRILGIVYVAKSKTVSDGEKALWIVGFILMGFVTAIVFLVMAKGRKFAE